MTCVHERAAFVHIVKDGSAIREALRKGMKGRWTQICRK